MLEIIRQKMQGTLATIIVSVICAAFALWGVETLFQGKGSKNAVATVNGADISERELTNAIEMMRRQYQRMLGGQVDSSFLNDKMLREPALQGLISRKLLQQQADKLGMKVGTRAVEQSIVTDPVFSSDGKTFDAEIYQQKLHAAGISPAMYQAQLREQAAIQHLQNGVATTAFVTPAQIQAVANLMAQKRSFEQVIFPLQQYVETAQVADDAVEAYYKDHQGEFLSDEKVAIEYLEVSKTELAKTVSVTDEELHASFDKETADFKGGNERRVAHILVDAKPDGSEQAKLAQIRKRLDAGEDFAKLAKEFSTDTGSAAQGGDVGFTTGQSFVPEFEATVAKLAKVGDVSEPVKTEFGYHIIKLLEERPVAAPSFEKRKPELEAQIRKSKASSLYTEKVDQLNESTYSAGDLAGPAQELSLTVQKSQPFGRRGGTGITAQKAVIDAAFAPDMLDSGKNSKVLELPGDRAVVLRVVEHQPAKVKALSEVQNQIRETLKREQATGTLSRKLEELKAKAAQAASLADIAQSEKLKMDVLKSQTREPAGGNPKAGVNPEVLEAAFAMPKPQSGQNPSAPGVVTVVALKNGDYALLHLTVVEEVKVQPDSPEYKAAHERLSVAAGNSEFSAYTRQLESSAKIIKREKAAE